MITTNETGTELFYSVDGVGEPLVLLPGPGQSHVYYLESGLAEMFSSRFQVVLMDFSGLGRSGRVDAIEPAQWCRDVVSVLDAAGIERAHLGGTSLGARIAARVAADSPQRVGALLVDMPITIVEPESEARIAAMFNAYENSPMTPKYEVWHGSDWRDVMRFFAAARAERPFQDYFTPRNYLGSVQAHTLICRGDNHNDAHPVEQAIEWHNATASSWLWIEPGSVHMALTQACPERVVETFDRFVKAVAEAVPAA